MKYLLSAILLLTISLYDASFIARNQNKKVNEIINEDPLDIYWSQYQKIQSKSNYIYCAGLEEFVSSINKSKFNIKLDTNSKFINDLFNGSKSWNPDKPNFKIMYMLKNNSATIQGKLDKSIPFKSQYKIIQKGFYFKGSKVNGIYPQNKEEIDLTCFIDNENFLFSTENQTINDQVFFMKTKSSMKSPHDIMTEFTNMINKGKEYRKFGSNDWRHWIEDRDSVAIPVINLSSEGPINEIINTKASINNKIFNCIQANYECNFILNEKGSKVKVDYELAYAAAAKNDEVIDKKLILNDDFYILLKRKE